ncbi:hypothetical protein BaRGS_00032256, partial [Batillaria attramentaria]
MIRDTFANRTEHEREVYLPETKSALPLSTNSQTNPSSNPPIKHSSPKDERAGETSTKVSLARKKSSPDSLYLRQAKFSYISRGAARRKSCRPSLKLLADENHVLA